MALSVEEVRRIAHLARLRLAPEEEETFARQLGQIVDYIDQLGGFATAIVEPHGPSLPEAEDVERGPLKTDEFLVNAPATLDSFFLVPQVKSPSDG